MKRFTWIGIALIALGVLAFVIPRITYTEEQVAFDVGPVEGEIEQQRSFTIPNILAGGLVAVGGGFLVVGLARGGSR